MILVARPMPLIEVARWVVAGLLASVLVVACVTDIKQRIIPNWTVATVIGLYVPWVFIGQSASVPLSLAAAAIALLATVPFCAFGLLGPGDSKLFTAVALFVGLGKLVELSLATAMAGGVLALVMILSHPTRALVLLSMRGRANFGQNVPYGVAIVAGTFVVVFGGLFGDPYN